MTFESEVSFDEAQLQEFVDRGLTIAARAVELAALDAWGQIRRNAPVASGRLASSFDIEQRSPEEWAIFSNLNYVRYVLEGTGIYGPKGQPIEPVSAQVLVFEVGGETIFARSVRGMEPNPFVDEALSGVEQRIADYAAMAIQEAGL